MIGSSMQKLLEEFKTFALRGNVIDLAIAVVIGATFGKIVSSVVDDLFMPFVGFMTGGVEWGALVWVLREGAGASPAIAVKYGSFLNAVLTFLIVAFVTFLVMRTMNRFLQKESERLARPSKEEILLTEIRDILKARSGK